MICKSCKQATPDGAYFCIHCGHRVQAQRETVSSEPVNSAPERRLVWPRYASILVNKSKELQTNAEGEPSLTLREVLCTASAGESLEVLGEGEGFLAVRTGDGRMGYVDPAVVAPEPFVVGGFWRRLLAFVFVDAILVGGLILAITMGIFMVVRAEKEWTGYYISGTLGSPGFDVGECSGSYHPLVWCESRTVYPSPQDILSSPLFWLPALGAFFLYLWFGNAIGQTLGKRALSLRVVDQDDEQPLGIPRGLLRTLGYGISAASLGIGVLAALWDRSGRTWHDRLARSVVIREP